MVRKPAAVRLPPYSIRAAGKRFQVQSFSPSAWVSLQEPLFGKDRLSPVWNEFREYLNELFSTWLAGGTGLKLPPRPT